MTYLTTPPHTPEHNGYSECRHRHIIEKGHTLLHQASILLIFWSYAFATVVYLINRMPKVGLSLGSSFEKLFHKDPDLSKLRVFGCLCFPWLRLYSSHKLKPKSSPCVFLGYSLTQSAFLNFDPILNKIFVSCLVKFVKNISPTHYVNLPRTSELFPITPPVLPSSCISPTHSVDLTRIVTSQPDTLC